MRKTLRGVYLGLILFFLYSPIAVMIVLSFNASRSRAKWGGFTFDWYVRLTQRSDILQALWVTLSVAVIATILATIIGTGAAIGVQAMKKRPAALLMKVSYLPMTMPDIVTGVSLMLLFVFVGRLIGAKNSLNFFTLLIAHITFNIPYVILNVLPKLNQTDPHLAEAAQDLGSPPTQAFFRVVLPAIMPGVTSGLMMAFTLSLDDFVISYYTTGTDFQTLPLFVFNMVKKPVRPHIYALYSIICLVVLAVLLFTNIYGMKEKKEKR